MIEVNHIFSMTGFAQKDARTADLGYQKGVAVFVIVKGGLMYTATVAGQKFSYKPLDKAS